MPEQSQPIRYAVIIKASPDAAITVHSTWTNRKDAFAAAHAYASRHPETPVRVEEHHLETVYTKEDSSSI